MNLSMDVNQDINISYMKKYIFDEISSLHDHQKIIHLLDIYKVKYTNNKNGIYYNLSTSSDEIIKNIYILLSNEKKNMVLSKEKDMKLKIMKQSIEQKPKTLTKKKVDIQHKLPLTLDMFTNKEQNIINLSKQYKL
tara:strand:+ start:596 stop:1003 length:408 start_codon:yes stop_codon:yes gene_type:complete